ncbi:MAG: phosphotransferase [Proteobacteria bacterium]|nr:phosphotransferase [Pseudomonadota bacterium]
MPFKRDSATIFLMVATTDDYFQNFLASHFGSDNFKVYQLAGDASNRRYYRVIKDGQSWVLMRWEPFDPKKYPFLSVLEHFAKHSIKVPQVINMSPKEGLVLLEDLGDLTLERKFWEAQNPESSIPFYRQAIDEVVKIHFPATVDRTDCIAFSVQFDTEKLLWEMNYGLDNLILGVLKFQLQDSGKEELLKCFSALCERLHKEPKFIAHRDYHSRNLMIKFDEMRVIDFQDARLGPIQYDLVSLFRDSYVTMSDSMANELMEYYLQQAKPYMGSHFSRDHFDLIYELQTVQRCFKACGSFSSFYHQRGDTRYLKYISHTLKRVLKSLTLFPEYKIFADVLIDSGALDRKYEVT